MTRIESGARGHPRAWIALPLAWALAAGCTSETAPAEEPTVAAAPDESAMIEKDVVRRLDAAGLGAVPDAVASLTPVLTRVMTEHAANLESGAYDGPQGSIVRGKLLETVRSEATAAAPSVAFETIVSVFPELR